jgi:DNA (cytosine-5)-methyltransferase 1
MNVLDLFSGIGGFSLGLERAGMRTVAFCEIDPYCRRVLAKHWPDVPVYDDVRTLTAERLAADVDVIAGGFPCQDISTAGKGAGITGERSGLWKEYARIIGEVRPRYVIVENVAALLSRGLGDVLGDLSTLGYDAEWHCIPASAVGAPHRRDRIWIVATDANRNGEHAVAVNAEMAGASQHLADAAGGIRQREAQRQTGHAALGGEDVADADNDNGHGRRSSLQMGWGQIAREIADDGEFGRVQWGAEPDVGRVAHGVPARVDRLRSLGNAVVPQIPEIIGRAIMRASA